MTEPFNIDENPAPSPTPAQPKESPWDKAMAACKSVWKQTLTVARKGETFAQLPLALAVIGVIAFPQLAALVLVLGLVFGYSFTVHTR